MKEDIKFIQHKRNVIAIDSMDQLNDIVSAKEGFFKFFEPSLKDGEVIFFRCRKESITTYPSDKISSDDIDSDNQEYTERTSDYTSDYLYVPATIFFNPETQVTDIVFPYGLTPRSIEGIRNSMIKRFKELSDADKETKEKIEKINESIQNVINSIDELKEEMPKPSEITEEEYNALDSTDENTVYFIKDKQYIYFRGVKYSYREGIDLNPFDIEGGWKKFAEDNAEKIEDDSDYTIFMTVPHGSGDNATPDFLADDDSLEAWATSADPRFNENFAENRKKIIENVKISIDGKPVENLKNLENKEMSGLINQNHINSLQPHIVKVASNDNYLLMPIVPVSVSMFSERRGPDAPEIYNDTQIIIKKFAKERANVPEISSLTGHVYFDKDSIQDSDIRAFYKFNEQAYRENRRIEFDEHALSVRGAVGDDFFANTKLGDTITSIELDVRSYEKHFPTNLLKYFPNLETVSFKGDGLTPYNTFIIGTVGIDSLWLTLPSDLFANNKKITSFAHVFEGFHFLSGETPYVMIDGVKTKLWELEGKPGYPEKIDGTDCFKGCTKLDDYNEIPEEWGGPEKRHARIVYTNDNGSTFRAVKSNRWKSELGTPVGVELIPASHNVYGNGKAGILALKYANGGNEIPWEGNGKSYQDIPSLKNYEVSPNVEVGSNDVSANEDHYTYLPSTIFDDGVENPLDKGTQWSVRSESGHLIPSPYNLDGTRNPSYYQTTAPMSDRNACADFDGKGNTDKIIELYGTDGEDYAAKAAKKTENGLDWYLPSAGEFGYLAARFKEIQEALSMITDGSATAVETYDQYWSSTEYGASHAWHAFIGHMSLSGDYKESFKRVRSVAQVTITED